MQAADRIIVVAFKPQLHVRGGVFHLRTGHPIQTVRNVILCNVISPIVALRLIGSRVVGVLELNVGVAGYEYLLESSHIVIAKPVVVGGAYASRVHSR